MATQTLSTDDLLDAIGNLSVVELSQLIEKFKEKFGVTIAAPAAADDFKPAVIFDTGGKFDKSFNEAAYTGAERFRKETGIAYREFDGRRQVPRL